MNNSNATTTMTTSSNTTTISTTTTTAVPDGQKFTAVVMSISDTTMLLKPDKGYDAMKISDRFILAR